MSRLLSVNVGLPRDIAWRGETVRTAVWKEAVQGRRMVRQLNIDGDKQGDLVGHGGIYRAILVYQIDSYPYWERHFGRHDFVLGQFGENFTVDGLSDEEVCIGDRYRIGSALFEVTQPRVTCYRVGIRMNEPQMAALLVAHRRPGFYFRVLQEGEVGAGDEIVKVAEGPERMTVVEVDGMLYLSQRTREQLERALRIPALSPGWRASFQSLLEQVQAGRNTTGGNPGLVPSSGPPPAWQGFRALRVSSIERESRHVSSLVLVSTDHQPLAAALPGQFVALRLKTRPDTPALLRDYSLSNAPSTDHYRVSIKQEEHGAASTYLLNQARVGDVLDVSAPRGNFTPGPGTHPVALLSAGIGVTPVLAILHTLAAEASPREVWWLHGARNGEERSFAQESRQLLQTLPHSHSYILYSRPGPLDRPGLDFDAPGRLTMGVIQKIGVPRDADFYLCGPPAFLQDLTSGLVDWGIPQERVHTEIFGPGEASRPGLIHRTRRPPHPPVHASGTGPLVSFARSGVVAHWEPKFGSLLEFAEACDVPVRWSCRTGVCHSCESGLIAGSVDYQPEPLEPPADGNVLICCSRPRGEVTLDL